jgi:hypothetical protein
MSTKLEKLNTFMGRIEPYYVLTVIALGLVGNTVSFVIFSFTKLK